MKHVASCSFGKDSLATILLALEHGEPLDEAVYCEVMFDKEISGEVPEHRDFIYTTAIPALERRGVKVSSQAKSPAVPRRAFCVLFPSADGVLFREIAS